MCCTTGWDEYACIPLFLGNVSDTIKRLGTERSYVQ